MKLPNVERLNLIVLGFALTGCATVSAPTGEAANVRAAQRPALVDPAQPAPSDVGSLVRQAQLQRLVGDLAGASQTLSQLVLVAADDPRVVGEYGKALAASGQYDDAIAFLGRAIDLQANDWTLYSALGVAYDEKGDYAPAQKAYAQALTLKPGDPTVLSNAALSHMMAGDLDTSERMLLEANRANTPDDKVANNLKLVQSLKLAHGQTLSTANAAPDQTAMAGAAALAVAAAEQEETFTGSAKAQPREMDPKLSPPTGNDPAPTPLRGMIGAGSR